MNEKQMPDFRRDVIEKHGHSWLKNASFFEYDLMFA